MIFEWQFIDSLDFVNKNRELCGEIAAALMPRLQDMLAESGDYSGHGHQAIGYVLRGFRDKNGKPLLQMELDGCCQLLCQRCLQGFNHPFKLVSQLRLIEKCDWDEHAEEDEGNSILVDSQLDVLALFEEEILLSLPFAPKHAIGTCRPVMEGYVVEEMGRIKESPFAVLSGLRKK